MRLHESVVDGFLSKLSISGRVFNTHMFCIHTMYMTTTLPISLLERCWLKKPVSNRTKKSRRASLPCWIL